MKRTTTLSLYEYQKRLFFILCSFLFLTAMVYSYFLNETIRDVVYLDENQKQMAQLRSNLSTLENEYLKKSKELTLDKAYTLGFVDASTPTYLSYKDLGSALTLNNASR